MSEYRLLVTGGYPILPRGGAVYEAEALVYTYGGRVVARFIRGGSTGRAGGTTATPEWKRERVRKQAEDWIRAHEA